MERRGWWLALGGLLIAAIGVGFWLSRPGDASAPARLGADASDPSGGGGGAGGGLGGGGGGGDGPYEANVRRGGVHGDAGVPSAGRRVQVNRGDRTAGVEARPSADSPNRAEDENRSSGWRLGRARRRIELLTARSERYHANIERLRREGQPVFADRQQAILDRTDARLAETRAEAEELTQAAGRDGTMDDVQAGYEEGESAGSRTAHGQLPPAE